MKITSVICEYNPFHLGHAYQLSEIKKATSSAEGGAVIAIMSGSFTQRGSAAVVEKYERARAAVMAGADLVLELPFPYSAARADIFGAAGVRIASALGCVDALCFGSESGDLPRLLETDARLSSAEFQTALSVSLSENRALSHRAAMSAAYDELYGRDSALSGSNDILALSYLAALRKEGGKISPMAIRRVGEDYNGGGAGFASATSIRAMLSRGEFDAVRSATTPEMAEILIKASKNGEIAEEERLFSLFAALVRGREDVLRDLPDVPTELAARMASAAKAAKNTEEFLSLAATKLYSHSRIRRGMIYALLDVKASNFSRVGYTTVLAANAVGREILSRIRKTAQIPIITKPADAVNFGEAVARAFALSARADSIWELACAAPRSGERMMREHPRMISQ